LTPYPGEHDRVMAALGCRLSQAGQLSSSTPAGIEHGAVFQCAGVPLTLRQTLKAEDAAMILPLRVLGGQSLSGSHGAGNSGRLGATLLAQFGHQRLICR